MALRGGSCYHQEMHEELLSELSSAGRRDSSGGFTFDLKRLLPTLARFQLPSRELIVLRLLACAVASGARYFEYRPAGTGYQCSWDAVWPAEDLDRLFEFITVPRAERSELAVAVNAALGYGARVKLTSGGQGLQLDGSDLRRAESPGEDVTRVEVTWSGWKAGLGRTLGRAQSREQHLLATRGALAPLELRGALERRDLPLASEVIRVGEPPWKLSCTGSLPARARGAGYVLLGTARGEVRLVVNGVSYVGEPYAPMVTILWWGFLPLDLTREQPVRGEEWAALHADLRELVLDVMLEVPGGRPEWRSWLMGLAGVAPSRLDAVALIRRADGSLSSLNDLADQFERDGFLPVSRRVFTTRAWPAREVVLLTQEFEAVQARFPHCLPVDHLAGVATLPRLPDDHPYLLRLPLTDRVGELGLRSDGVTLQVVGPEGMEPAPALRPSALCRALLSKRLGAEQQLPAARCVLEVLQKKGPSIRRLLKEGVTWEDGSSWSAEDFQALTRVGGFQTVGGTRCSLHDLLAAAKPLYWSYAESPPRGMPSDAFMLDPRTGSILSAVLDGALEQFEHATHYTTQGLLAMRSDNVGSLMLALWRDRRSVSFGLLSGLKIPPTCTDSMGDIWGEVARLNSRCWTHMVSTDLLLLALLNTAPQPFLAWLKGGGVDPDALRRTAVTVRGEEALGYLAERALRDDLAIWHELRAKVLHAKGDWEEAWRASQAGLERDRQLCLPTAAFSLLLLERHQEALEYLDESLADQTPDRAMIWLYRAEVLLGLGRVEEALAACRRGDACSGYQAGLLGRVHLARGEFSEALKQADLALQGAHAASAHETRARALWEMQRWDEARAAYRQFVNDARLYGLQENRVPERLCVARERAT